MLGVFQLTIPVGTKEALLAPEERRLSVLRWIEKSIPLGSRWYLVFQRYVQQIAGRVRDMGGDPDRVIADPNGDWHQGGHGGQGHGHPQRHGHFHEHEGRHGEELIAFRGKVAGLIYDRFGNFAGFLLETEDAERRFESREHEVETLVKDAWVERIPTTVYAARHEPDRPLWIVLRGAPVPF